MRRGWGLNLAPVSARWLRFVGAAEDFRAAAISMREIAATDETEVPPALFLPEDLARIRGTDRETRLEIELERVQGGSVRHAATLAFTLRDVQWSAGHVHVRRAHHRATNARPRLWSRDAAESVDRAIVASTIYGCRYFGHWLTDDVPLAMMAREIAQPIVPLGVRTAHQRQYLELFRLRPRAIDEARVRELTILDDIGANASKRLRWERMRARVRALCTKPERRGVMLLRKGTGIARPLTNELQIAESLAKRGFEIIEAETLSVRELAQRIGGANIVLGVEGSQLLHGVFAMADRGVVVTLQPPDRFITAIKVYCDALGLRYAFAIGEAVGEGGAAGFRVDSSRVERIVDAALAA